MKLRALPGSLCDGLRTVLEQYFRHAWFFRHAVLECCVVGLSGSVYVAAAEEVGADAVHRRLAGGLRPCFLAATSSSISRTENSGGASEPVY